MEKYYSHNGKLRQEGEASLLHDNRAFRYGSGLYETIALKDGEAALWDLHKARLLGGMEVLGMKANKHFADTLLPEIKKVAIKNGLDQHCRVRLQVYNGNGGLYDGDGKVGYLISCYPLNEEVVKFNENGLVVGIAEGLHKSKDRLSNLKSTNGLLYEQAAQMAKANRWNDALILNTDNEIIESTIANIWWVKGDVIFTPPLASGCVAGVMRAHLFSVLPNLKFEIKEANLTNQKLAAADEVFLTNAIRPVRWVGDFEGKVFGKRVAEKISSQLLNAMA